MLIIRLTLACFFAALAVCVASSMPADAGVMIPNGDFSVPGADPQPFQNWITSSLDPRFTLPSNGDGSVVGFARFSVTNVGAFVQLEQMFDLPANASNLTFDFMFATADGGDITGSPGEMIADIFQVALFDSQDMPVNPNQDLLPAFFAVAADSPNAPYLPPSGVGVSPISSGWQRVTLDLSSVSSGRYTLEFMTRGGNDGRTTTVDVDNVMVSQGVAAIPEPASILIWGLLSTGAIAPILRRSKRQGLELAG